MNRGSSCADIGEREAVGIRADGQHKRPLLLKKRLTVPHSNFKLRKDL